MKYYYFIATLPSLSMDEPPSLSMDRFLALCDEHLTASDRDEVQALAAEESAAAAGSFAHGWREMETQLRNACVRQRAARRRESPEAWLRPQEGVDLYLEKSVADAFAEKDPLSRERALDRVRWRRIEDLSGLDPFAPERVFAYALHLRMAERWAAHDADKGLARVEALTARGPADLNQEAAAAPAGRQL